MSGSGPNNAHQTPDPRISIILPVGDGLERTRACLETLYVRTPGIRHEIIVVDGASSDGTADYLRDQAAEGRIVLRIERDRPNWARARNLGAAMARGEHLLFLDPELIVGQTWLEPLTRVLDEDPFVGAAAGRHLAQDGTIRHAGIALMMRDSNAGPILEPSPLWRGKPADAFAANSPQIMSALSGAGLLVRSRAFFEVVGFDEGYTDATAGTDLCLKLVEAGWRLVYRPESTAVDRSVENTPTAADLARLDARWRERAHPDYYVDLQGGTAPAPDFSIRAYAAPRVRWADAPERPRTPALASIIILTHDALAHTKRCLESVLAHTDPRHEILCVDNASSDGTTEWLAELGGGRDPRVTVIFNQENLGVPAGNNLGLARARGDYLVLLNPDTVVVEDWLDRLIACAEAHPQVGVVGPVSNSVTGTQKLAKIGYDPDTLKDLDLFARMHSDALDGQDEPALWVSGFCMLIKRELLARIGGLDDRYGLGTFEDTDYCLRTFLAGYQTMIAADCFVHHAGGRSFAAAAVDYRAALEANWDVFKAKWRIPADTAYAGRFDLESIVVNGFNPVLHHHPLPRIGGVTPIEPTPAELELRLREGEDLFHAGRIEDAETLFRHVLWWDSDDARAANDLAVVLWRLKKIEEAGEVLEDLLRQDPENVDAAHTLAEIRKGRMAAKRDRETIKS